jgi:TonB family protein
MKHTLRPILFLSLLTFSAFGLNDSPPTAPQTDSVEPRVGKPGTTIKIKGKALDKSHVDEVYLTDHRFDMKVKILDQGEGHLTIRVPPFVRPGRLQLLLLTSGNNPVYLEQPWYVQIESDDETSVTPPAVEISQAPKPKPTVEVASIGSTIPVPVGGTPPSPATTSGLEKSVVPLKAAPKPEPPPQPETRPQVETQPQVQTQPQAPILTHAAVQTEPVQQQPAPAVVSTPQPAVVLPSGPKIPQQPAVEAGNIPAQLVQRARVSYPAAAQAQRIEGTVELVATIGTDGKVKSTKVLKGNPYLASAAIVSVREWVYEPAYLHGKPVPSDVTIVLNFKRPE